MTHRLFDGGAVCQDAEREAAEQQQQQHGAESTAPTPALALDRDEAARRAQSILSERAVRLNVGGTAMCVGAGTLAKYPASVLALAAGGFAQSCATAAAGGGAAQTVSRPTGGDCVCVCAGDGA